MKQAIAWLFGGFVLSSVTISVGAFPLTGPLWGSLVLFRGMRLTREATQNTPVRDLEAARALSLGIALLCAVTYFYPAPLLGCLAVFCYVLRSERLFAYLEDAGALAGRDPSTLHAQRRVALYLNGAAFICAVSALLLPIAFLNVAGAIALFAAFLYQAWAMNRLKNAL